MPYVTLPTLLDLGTYAGIGLSVTSTIANASGEYSALVAQVFIPGGGSKTISAAGGGAIIWRTASVTFGDGGSTFELGIQGVSQTTGIPDGVFSTKASLTGGGGGITANSWLLTPMTTGSKTISDGEEIALMAIFTTRVSPDSVAITRISPLSVPLNTAFSYGVINTGAAAKAAGGNIGWIVFDDGTIGSFYGTSPLPPFSTPNIAFNQTSSPDEYAAIFTPPFNIKVKSVGISIIDVVAGDNFELILYEDALGTPVALQTVTPDTDVIGSSVAQPARLIKFITETELVAGVTYAIALRATTNNDIGIVYEDFSAGLTNIVNAKTIFGSSLRFGGRTDQTGAFATIQTYYSPLFSMLVSEVELGGSAGGGLHLVGTGGLVG